MFAKTLDRRNFLVQSVALSASALLLSACGGIVGPPDASPMYVLNPVLPAPTGGPAVNYRIAVELPDAPDYLDTTRIAIERGNMADFYANALWQERLPRSFRRAIIEALENSKRVPVVSSTNDGLRSDYFLKTDIRDFTARYDGGDGAPVAVVRIEAKMVEGFGSKTVSSTIISREVPAGENSVQGAVMAFNQATAAVLVDLVNWALSAPAGSKG